MSDLTVRAATVEDVTDIQRIARRGWEEAYGEFLSQSAIDAAMEEWYDASVTVETVEREDIGYFVAVEDGAVLGYASGGPSGEDGVAYLGAIYVDPERWAAGIGTLLLDRFEQYCRRKGFDTLTFRVLMENEVGTAFYRKHGYEAVEEREESMFGETVSEYVFRGEL